MTKVGIYSTLLAIRLFSFLTLFFSGISIFYVAKKITGHLIYAVFASLLYLSAPYLHMDYYWRGGLSSSLCFVFLPILLLSLYYFTKEKFIPYLFTFVISMTLIIWTHLITGVYTLIIFIMAIAVIFFFIKNKPAAFLSTLVAGFMIGIITSPFWSLLLQQFVLQTHVIFSPDYAAHFTINRVADNAIYFPSLFDLQPAVWQFRIRKLTALFNLINLTFFVGFILHLRLIGKMLNSQRFLYTLIGLLILLIILTITPALWLSLPAGFAYIQYPHRLLLQATPILSLLAAFPLILINTFTRKRLVLLGSLGIFITAYTFKFNNFELFQLSSLDYTTFSIIQAMGEK